MTTKEFYDYHIELLAKGDVDELVNHDYCEDAQMLMHVAEQPIHVIGRKAIREQLDNYLKNIYKGFVSTEKLLCTEDSIYLEATIDTAWGPSKVYDALYMKDGKIFRHYSGLKA